VTGQQVVEAVRAILAEKRKRFVPDETAQQGQGALGFDYGYQQALREVESALYLIPDE